MSKVGVIIAAAGKGSRLGGRTPKQFMKLGGTTILERSIDIFTGMAEINAIVVVVPPAHVQKVARLLKKKRVPKIAAVVAGGRERQHSVWNGLKAFPHPPEIILVHDAARPLVSRRIVRSVIRETSVHGAAVVGQKLSDTVKVEKDPGFYSETLDRNKLWTVQTPQGFRFKILFRAHENARRRGFVGTDEASLVERLRKPIRIVEGERTNIKITTRKDLKLAQVLLTTAHRLV